MHNSPQANLEFQITWTEGNLFWLLGESVPDEKKIQSTRTKLTELRTALAKMLAEKQ
jgi:hypothetical protein